MEEEEHNGIKSMNIIEDHVDESKDNDKSGYQCGIMKGTRAINY